MHWSIRVILFIAGVNIINRSLAGALAIGIGLICWWAWRLKKRRARRRAWDAWITEVDRRTGNEFFSVDEMAHLVVWHGYGYPEDQAARWILSARGG
jgi:hypothetical protein